MQRIVPVTLAWLTLVALGAPARGADEITYHDRAGKNPTAKVLGVILAETAEGIKVRPAGKEAKLIPAADIIEVDYQPPSDISRIDFHRPFNLEQSAFKPSTREDERPRLLNDALKGYRAMLPLLAEKKNVQRYAEFRLAQLLARLAEQDAARREDAIDALTRYKTEHADSWEITAAMKTLARLHELARDLPQAQKVYEEMAARKDLAKETRQEADLALVNLMLQAKQYPRAEQRLQELSKALPANDPLLARMHISLAQCQIETNKFAEAEKLLHAVIGGSVADPATKGLACNTLADGYRRTGKPEEALWQYLWVDVLYNQDPEQHAKALYHLARLFKEVRKDPQRAQQCLEQLRKDRQFAGLEYQKLALEEKP